MQEEHSKEFDLLVKVGQMWEDDEPIEDIYVFMIENGIGRVAFTSGTVLDPKDRVLH